MQRIKVKSLEAKEGSPERCLDNILFPIVTCFQFGGGARLSISDVTGLLNDLERKHGISAQFGKTLSNVQADAETDLLEYNVGLATTGADSILFKRASCSEGFLYQIAAGLREILSTNRVIGAKFDEELKISGADYTLDETLVGISDFYPEGRALASDF